MRTEGDFGGCKEVLFAILPTKALIDKWKYCIIVYWVVFCRTDDIGDQFRFCKRRFGGFFSACGGFSVQKSTEYVERR